MQNGLRLRTAGQFDSAVTMFEAIASSRRPGTPQALQELIGLYASRQRFDDAFRALEGARAAGADLSGISSRPDIAPLRADPRFAALFPGKTAFDAPFVERARIIHEWRGDSAGDEFGWIARGIGDVDGDRVTDVIVSATMHPPLGDSRGKLYAYSGKSGRLLWRRDGERGWVLGSSVEAAGDVNGDGVPDVVAGAPFSRLALVYSGRDGVEIHRFAGDTTEAGFGVAVSAAGDVDGDGFGDVLVGASGATANGMSGAGKAIVFSGKTGARVLTMYGERVNDAFGASVAGDATRSAPVFAVGAPGAGASSRGRVYMFRANARAGTNAASANIAAPQFTQDADSTGGALGAMFVAITGDIDGDGVRDVYASDFANSARGPATGRVYVYSGANGKTVLTLTGESAGEGFGTSSSKAGDVDGDGRADLAVGSWQFGGAAWSGGRVRVHSGRDGHVLQQFTGKVPGETLGFDSVGIGDVNGDGIEDFLVTSAYSLVRGQRSGRVYVVAGERSPTK